MDRKFDTKGVPGVRERVSVTYLTPGRGMGEQPRIGRLAAGGVDAFRDCEVSLYGERTTLYERAASEEVETTFAADEERKDDQTREEGLWQEFDDALDIDLGVEDDQEERATWDAATDLVGNTPTSTDDATYYLWKTNMLLPDDTEAALERMKRLYPKRWRIESAYRYIEGLLPATMSRSHWLRFWYFGSSSLLYNCWRLVNVLLRVESPETHKKPAIPAVDVVEFVRREAGIG